MRSTAWRLAAALAMIGVAFGQQDQDDNSGSFQGIRYQLVEQAHDGDYPVPVNSRVFVDKDADLYLEFATIWSEVIGDPSPEWQRLFDAAQIARELARDRARFAPGDPLDDQARAAYGQEIEVLSKAADLLDYQLKSEAGFSRTLATSILSGGFPEGSPQASGYANLVAWIRRELSRLREEARTVGSNGKRYEVQVQAFLDERTGQIRSLHVENYDELPKGELQPIMRTAYRYAAEDQRFLNMSRDMDRRVTQALNAFDDAVPPIQQNQARALERFDAAFEALTQKIKGGLLDPLDRALEARGQLSAVTAAETARTALTAVLAQIDALGERRADIDAAYEAAGAVDLGQSGGEESVDAVLKALSDLAPIVEQWQGQVDAFKAAVADPDQGQIDGDEDETLTILADGSADRLGFAENLAAVRSVYRYLRLLDPMARAASQLTQVEEMPEPRGLPNLPNALVSLSRAGWTRGDLIRVVLRFREPGAEDDLLVNTYRVAFADMGFFTTIAPNLVFIRDEDDPDKSWKPNVAALVGWQYQFREPQKFERLWNWLGLGGGIHLASLDQSDESVEFGVGVNLVLWNGLVTAGYGQNISASGEKNYSFLGVNLLDILNQGKK